jgi:hypothetical protein
MKLAVPVIIFILLETGPDFAGSQAFEPPADLAGVAQTIFLFDFVTFHAGNLPRRGRI